MDKVIEKWDEILQIVKVEYDVANVAFNTWLKPLKVYEVRDNVVTILVPSEQSVLLDIVNKKYRLPLQVTICEVTGMESCEIIQGIVQQTSPDCIITIDALAARSAFRLGTTVQHTDAGIRPGSGVGNARKGITKENMKIPVIAIGIPTVVSAAAIVSDAMDSLKQIGYNETILGSIAMLDKEEYYQLISEVFAPELGSLFVMPKNLDEELDTMGSLLAASLSQVICKR